MKLIPKLKTYGRLLMGIHGFLYDYIRFAKFSAWKAEMSDPEIRNYHVVKIYHALEKSMSFKNRNLKSGWSAAFLLIGCLKKAKVSGNLRFHDRAGVDVLRRFINLPGNKDTSDAKVLLEEIEFLEFPEEKHQGIKSLGIKEFHKGILGSPENFFFSRFSLREFKGDVVPKEVIEKAISLAIKTPSVCNRQPWHVYHTETREVIDTALGLQSGNRGFGHLVSNLIIITVDLKAFMSGTEHFQHWIEGGLFSMSLIYAFHSIGIASCCLNWSQSPQNDKKLREKINIENNHTVIMMLAFGYPKNENTVCVSARRPVKQFYSKLKIK